MKTPLQYQMTEYDCGPVCVFNALRYLFERAQIPPTLPHEIALRTLDACNRRGEAGRGGTSKRAMCELSDWLNAFAAANDFPLRTEYLSGAEADASQTSRIAEALRAGGVAICRVMYACWHYVLLNGLEGDTATMFDPYLRTIPYRKAGIEVIWDSPTINRRVDFSHLDAEGKSIYALGPRARREVILLFNTQKSEDNDGK